MGELWGQRSQPYVDGRDVRHEGDAERAAGLRLRLCNGEVGEMKKHLAIAIVSGFVLQAQALVPRDELYQKGGDLKRAVDEGFGIGFAGLVYSEFGRLLTVPRTSVRIE